MTHAALHIGLVLIFGIVMLPVYVMIAGWLFGEPREYRPVVLGFGFMVAAFAVLIVALAVLGVALSLIVPS